MAVLHFSCGVTFSFAQAYCACPSVTWKIHAQSCDMRKKACPALRHTLEGIWDGVLKTSSPGLFWLKIFTDDEKRNSALQIIIGGCQGLSPGYQAPRNLAGYR